MSWDKKARGGRYFYHCRRIDGRPVKVYVGKGPQAEKAARDDALSRDYRRALRQAQREEMARLEVADRCLEEVVELAELLVAVQLLLAGYHLHHGEWRQRRIAKDELPQ
jgi:hypothetical protein